MYAAMAIRYAHFIKARGYIRGRFRRGYTKFGNPVQCPAVANELILNADGFFQYFVCHAYPPSYVVLYMQRLLRLEYRNAVYNGF